MSVCDSCLVVAYVGGVMGAVAYSHVHSLSRAPVTPLSRGPFLVSVNRHQSPHCGGMGRVTSRYHRLPGNRLVALCGSPLCHSLSAVSRGGTRYRVAPQPLAHWPPTH